MRSTFTKAYNSIPKELFDIKLFQFDTQVLPVTIRKDGALDFIGGGGTYFENIERFLLGTHPVGTDTKKKYPEVVVVFTDGDGGRVQPKHPDRWYWFLDTRGNNWNGRNYFASKLPKKSHVHYLEDVVPD